MWHGQQASGWGSWATMTTLPRGVSLQGRPQHFLSNGDGRGQGGMRCYSRRVAVRSHRGLGGRRNQGIL